MNASPVATAPGGSAAVTCQNKMSRRIKMSERAGVAQQFNTYITPILHVINPLLCTRALTTILFPSRHYIHSF